MWWSLLGHSTWYWGHDKVAEATISWFPNRNRVSISAVKEEGLRWWRDRLSGWDDSKGKD